MTNEPMTAATALRCPKCEAPMRTYERSGVNVDRCTECGGIFLDRGELERLMDAETTHYGSTDGRYGEDRRRSRRDDRNDDDDGGFLGNLFAFG